ncbi:MAG: ATP-binding protein [Candidatus Reddybacter sp.]
MSIRTRSEEIGVFDGQALQLKPGDYVLISITDTGSGMDKETQEQVFDPFFSTKGSKGTGFGLSQVYGFVKQNKGAIKVYSEVNHGTQMVFYFPRDRFIDHGKKIKIITEELTHSWQATILIADDEPALLVLSEEILSQRGSRVLGFSGSRVLGFSGSRVIGLSGSRVLGFSGSRVLGFSGSRVLGFSGSRVLGLSGSRVIVFSGYRRRKRPRCSRGPE